MATTLRSRDGQLAATVAPSQGDEGGWLLDVAYPDRSHSLRTYATERLAATAGRRDLARWDRGWRPRARSLIARIGAGMAGAGR